MTTTCSVCYDDYTDIQRKGVPCISCGYSACVRCVKAFLLSTKSDPHCMNCKHAWNREFLDTHLTRSFREGELKKHRASVLFDRERSLLPATQPAVEIELECRKKGGPEMEYMVARRAELQMELGLIEQQMEANKRFIARALRGEDPYAGAGAAEQTKERRQFVAACPKESCRGFLSQAYKCGTCQDQFCAHCREIKTEDHTCDPALVETMKAIVKDSRGCPSCGMAISRVSGCDQMYCTQCDTAFSYATGKVMTGVIHNPHYYERVRALNGGVAPRNPGDNPCGGWPDYWTLRPRLVCLTSDDQTYFRTIMRSAIHVQNVVLPEMPVDHRPDHTRMLRVRFLLNELTEKELSQKLQQHEKRRGRNIEVRQPLELFVVSVLEVAVTTNNMPAAEVKKRIPELLAALKTTVEDHINIPLRAIGDRYGNVVPQISPKGEYMSYGYSPKKGKEKTKAKVAAPENVISHADYPDTEDD
jgi:hypothetical protein